MKKITTIILLMVAFTICAVAQPSAVKKASKSVFTLTTFSADGIMLTNTHGVFVGAQGEAISLFSPFKGAATAVVVDASGKMYDVEAIIGANNTYDVCRFRINAKTTPLPCATTPAQGEAWLVNYGKKKPAITEIPIKSVETFMEKYSYYIFDKEIGDNDEGCPILNAAGEVIGLATHPSSNYSIHATDAQYFISMSSAGLSIHDPALQKTSIRIALPTELDQARLMLMTMDTSSDSLATERTIDEFNKNFPGEIDGYSTRSRIAYSRGLFDVVDATMNEAINKAAKRDEAYAEYCKYVYNKCIYMPDSIQPSWTLDKALELVDQALSINPNASYKHQKAQIQYSKGDYQAAFDLFSATSEEIPTSEVYYEMAQSKSQLGSDAQEVLSILDKAVEACPKPLTAISAPYYLERGYQLEAIGELRKAIADYNVYDTLMMFRASDTFYYQRYKCEKKMRMYQQALVDIAHATYINQMEPLYPVEYASLCLQIGKYDEAIVGCERCLAITDESADAYIIKGVALGKKGMIPEAREALLKAKELGDERADGFLEQFK